MLNILFRIIRLSGKRKMKIITGMIASVLEAITTKVPFILILFALMKILDKSLTMNNIYILSAALAGDLILGCIFNYFGRKNLSVPAYKIFGEERLKLGDRIKRFAMGYFTDGNIGDLTAVVTSDIKFIEEFGAVKLGDLVSTLFASGVVLIMLFFISTPVAIVTMIACGKTLTCKSIMQLLPERTFNVTGVVAFKNKNMLQMTEKEAKIIIGKDISMIMQNPMTAFNPMSKIGSQIIETLRAHMPMSKKEAYDLGIEGLKKMNLARAHELMNSHLMS